MSFPNYVLNANLTNTYIQSLITRNGFTDVTSQYPNDGELYAIQDVNGEISFYTSMSSVRDSMILQYLIMSNS